MKTPDTIKPEYVESLGLLNDSMPSIEDATKVFERVQSAYEEHSKKHKTTYKKESQGIFWGWEDSEKHLKDKSPKYIRDFRISKAELAYLKQTFEDAKDLLSIVTSKARDEDLELRERNEKVTVADGMVPMMSPLEDFLTQLQSKRTFGGKTEFDFSHCSTVKSAKELLADYRAATPEEREKLDEDFQTELSIRDEDSSPKE